MKKKKYILQLLTISILLSSCIRLFHRDSKEIIHDSKVIEKSIKDTNDKTTNLFHGDIIDIETNEKIPIVQIELSKLSNKYHTLTDSIGEFQFKNLTSGCYQVRFFYVGYKTLTIDSLVIENGKDIKVRIGLKSDRILLYD